jgi:hypothetical protein
VNKIPKEILNSVEPENREIFKKVYAKTMHLRSTSFLVQWSLVVICFLWGLLFLFLHLFPEVLAFFHVELIPTTLILGFLLVFPFNFLTTPIRLRLNQTGILFVHGLCITIAIAVVFFAFSLRMKLF